MASRAFLFRFWITPDGCVGPGASHADPTRPPGMHRLSYALIDQPGEVTRIDDEVAELRIKGRGRPRGNSLIARASLLLELRNVVPYNNEHVAELFKLGPVADGIAVARND